MRESFSIDAKETWLLDGAMGTNLFLRGLISGDAPELWNLERPDDIRAIHQNWIEAGSDIILTNSFGGSAFRLKLHHADDKVFSINKAAAQIAREIADAQTRPVYVAGSVGPTGELMAPLGSLEFEQAVTAFSEQMEGLVQGGADIIWIETLSDKTELEAALKAASLFDLPIACTLSFDTNGKTMMGIEPAALPQLVLEAPRPPLALGANCGTGPAELTATLVRMAPLLQKEQFLIAKANCGIPAFVDGEIRYSGTPELMADYALIARNAGAKMIGGCCGTKPEHIRAMRNALETQPRDEPPSLELIRERLGDISESCKPKPARRTRRRG